MPSLLHKLRIYARGYLMNLEKNTLLNTALPLAMFPGQGSQAPGMAAGWLGSGAARLVLEEAETALKRPLGALMAENADAATLTQTQNAQPALLVVGLMAKAALEEAAGKPFTALVGSVAGHSLGEYTAVAAAGGLTVTEAVRLVDVRAQAMAKAPKGGMSAVLGLEPEVLEKALESCKDVWLANDNCTGQAVVAAELEALAAAEPVLQAAGAKRVLRLPVGGAFHTPLQTGASEAVAGWLEAHAVQPLQLPCWMNYTAQYHVNDKEIQENLVAQITNRVRWRQAMQNAAEAGVTQAIELGCGKVLSGLAGRCDGRLQAQSLSNLDDALRWLEAHC